MNSTEIVCRKKASNKVSIGPQNVKTTPKLSQNKMSKLKETKKLKIIALYEETPKQFEPDPNPQNSLFFTLK